MAYYISKRLAQLVVVVVSVVVIVFFLTHLSGDPVMLMLPADATRADIEEMRAQMGFNDPLLVQFYNFVLRLLHGDIGNSWRFREPAFGLVLSYFPATLQLALSSLLLSLVVAIPIGVYSAVGRNGKFDSFAMVFALLGQSVPNFWLGIMLILLFSVTLGWFPTSGRGGWEHLILPTLTLGLSLVGRKARLIRSSMLEVLGNDYVRTARAKGLSELRVINIHALKNAMLPVVTVVGLELGHLLGGAVIVETIFAWPGVGNLAVQAVFGRDYPVVQAAIILAALTFVVANLLIDLLYMWLDPRISYRHR